MLADDGILLFKYWLTVDRVQQEERFAKRRDIQADRLDGVERPLLGVNNHRDVSDS